jgi:transcriptional regulator with XRE-family HTH domain
MEERFNEEDIRLLVSKNLKRIRNLQNISQLDLGLESGLTHNFINDIENGKKGISCKSLAKLASALRVQPFQFFLPETVADDGFSGYVHALNDSFQKAVGTVMSHYLPEKEQRKK